MAMLLQISENVKEPLLSEEHDQNIKYHSLHPIQKKYFLVCRDCYWMVSTLLNSQEDQKIDFKKCPACENDLDKFSIPNL